LRDGNFRENGKTYSGLNQHTHALDASELNAVVHPAAKARCSISQMDFQRSVQQADEPFVHDVREGDGTLAADVVRLARNYDKLVSRYEVCL
jgi:hypothetical protein